MLNQQTTTLEPIVFVEMIQRKTGDVMPLPFIICPEMDLGDGFTLAPSCGKWELRRAGIFIGRFSNGAKAMNAALEVRFYLTLGGQDMLDSVNEAVKRWGGEVR